MHTSSAPSFIGKRYELQERLGAGAMGEVYRVKDRLTGDALALKRVNVPSHQLEFASRATLGVGGDIQFALAQEFRTLATLRHPNIISVLDYGFDEGRQPYFTMDLLENSQTLYDAAYGQSVENKVALLIQMLEALAYLHRRGILHRDLKPGNVLVENGKVRVLDFGLATTVGRTEGAGGTLPYMAPEVFRKEQMGPGIDLYAVGMMAYEMLTDDYPFNTGSAQLLIRDILYKVPDTSDISNRPLGNVVGRLLDKLPEDRYRGAGEVAGALAEAIGQAAPRESVAIRESFLQAAEFVGRDQELSQLSDALQDAINSAGSAWLVAGESGVGKSRLLDELRIHALVTGVQVMRGQGVEGGGLPFQLWRDIARQLLLSTPDMTEFEVSILKTIVPTIETIMGYAVDDPPPVIGGAGDLRTARVLAEMIQRQGVPLVLLLDDLQWTQESLIVVKMLVERAADFPILIVGSYRTDEQVTIKDELVGMQVIRLARLDSEAIATLSHSMLGENADLETMTNYLNRETEGNVFFVVEVLRALAEQTGGLDTIGFETLPSYLLTGGIQQVVERRLSRLPTDDLRVLELAAVGGRELDLQVLDTIMDDGIDFEGWLYRCAEAMVLEVDGHRWRFNHDKLRESLLLHLEKERALELYGQIAETIEQVYAKDLDQHAEVLVHHWRNAENAEKELEALLRYLNIRLTTHVTFADTSALLDRAYELAERNDTVIDSRIELLYLRSIHLSDPDEVRRVAIHEALRLAEAHNIPHWIAKVKYGMLRYEQNPHRHQEIGQEAIELFQELGNSYSMLQVEVRLIDNMRDQGLYEESEKRARELLAQANALNDRRLQVELLLKLSNVLNSQQKFDEALDHMNMLKNIAVSADDLGLLASNTVNTSILYGKMGDMEAAIEESFRAIDLFKRMDNISGMGAAYANLLSFHRKLENWAEVIRQGQEALGYARQRGVRWSLHVYYLQEMARGWWQTDRQSDAQIMLGALQQDGMTPQPMYEERLEELEELIAPADPDLVGIGARLTQAEMVAFALDEWSPRIEGEV